MARDWILILGCSSGFGAASAKAFADADYNIIGVHLDRASTVDQANAVKRECEELGAQCIFFNVNAADDAKRRDVIAEVTATLHNEQGSLRVLLHSLAFGSLLPFVPHPHQKGISSKQMSMTLEVMGHSLVWWTRDLVDAGHLQDHGRIFAMTSSGSHSAFHAYGAVGAAKAALESHVRYLAMELAPKHISVNAVLAGVTDTPALRKIPNHTALLENAVARNPSGRLTECVDVARCLVDLARSGTTWLTGNTLRIDGGEDICS